MRPKPVGLGPSYASQFNDASIVAAYTSRPPYPEALISLILDLAGGANGRILDLGCGTGELARRLALRLQSVTAMDSSERMITLARTLPGGDAPNIKWIIGHVEGGLPQAAFSLTLAAESFHWSGWDVLCAMLAHRLDPAPLVLVDRREVGSPWFAQLQPLVANFSTNRDFQPSILLRS